MERRKQPRNPRWKTKLSRCNKAYTEKCPDRQRKIGCSARYWHVCSGVQFICHYITDYDMKCRCTRFVRTGHKK